MRTIGTWYAAAAVAALACLGFLAGRSLAPVAVRLRASAAADSRTAFSRSTRSASARSSASIWARSAFSSSSSYGHGSPRSRCSSLAACRSQVATSMLTLRARKRESDVRQRGVDERGESESARERGTYESSMHWQCLVTLPRGSHRSVAKLTLSAQLKPRLKPEW